MYKSNFWKSSLRIIGTYLKLFYDLCGVAQEYAQNFDPLFH